MRPHPAQIGALALCVAMAPQAIARAALINDYSQTDDVWNAPIPAGHALIDARLSYTSSTQSPLVQPVASWVFGVLPGLETGLWSGYTITDPANSRAAGSSLLNPYLKYQLPWQLGHTLFGLVGGVQVPVFGNPEHDVALEGVASTPLSSTWTLDLGGGVGRQFVSPATLGHLNANLSFALPTGQSVFIETYALLSAIEAPVISQHVGVLFPLTKTWTADAGLSLNESAASGLGGISPQMGSTLLF